MAVLEVVKRIFDTPLNIVMEIVKYRRLSDAEKESYKVLYTIERVLPYLYIWLLIQMYIAISLFM
jgi:hypothetical protein